MDGCDIGIRKSGVYRKLKTSKKKFFIIREPGTSPACVEYYDTEKKYKQFTKPKRSVNLNSCFSINAKQDAKHDHIIVLFTKDDCLGIVFDTKEEQAEWLGIMLALLEESGVPRNNYDHVWQVNIKPEGLANGKCLHSGIYRLCLSKKSLSFIRLNNEDTDIEFQLATIRRCGHSKNFFFIESGNAAPTGAGELWMQVEDAVIANNIHDTLLKAMKANGKEDIKPTIRGRSHTMDKTHKPSSHMSGTKRNMSIGESSTLPRQIKAKSIHVSTENPSSPGRLRHSQSPSKCLNNHTVRPKSTFVSSSLSVSPASSQNSYNPFSAEIRCRADSMESHGSVPTDASSVSDDIDVEHTSSCSGAGSTNSDILEVKDYFAMDIVPKEITLSVSPDYGTSNEGYMKMDSPLGQTVSSHSMSENTDTDKYLTMSPEKADADGGYLDMQASSTMYCKGSSERLRPDKVPSLLSDSESVDEFPKRAYSVGSKPVPIQSGIGESYAYMEMTKSAIDKGKHKANSAPHLVDEIPDHGNNLALPSSQTDLPCQDNSRASTPRSTTPSLNRTYDQQDLLMEMDFQVNKGSGSHESLYECRSRTSSFGSKDFRSRTSSGGSKDFHSRTSSFSNDFRDRTDSTDSMTKHSKGSYIDPFRMRTQTVCQDSLRPRTSSFGPSDMRPRSSSHGNSRFKELSRRLKEKALQHRILDQSKGKKILKQTSKENVTSSKESTIDFSEYIDIDIKTASQTENKDSLLRQRKLPEPVHGKKKPLSDEEYIIIKPVVLCSDSEGSPVNQVRTTKHVHISPKVETITDHTVTSPHVKKTSVNRRDYTSGYFKHSSSSESVSSTSSSDFGNKSRIRKSSPQSLSSSSMGEYFEVVPHISPHYSSNLVGHNSKAESLEDSYIVYSPKAPDASYCLKDLGSLEKIHSPVNEETHSSFLNMDKIVSPIREEDNEAIFGPKPKVLSKDQTLLKGLKHEYVNVKFYGNKDHVSTVTDVSNQPELNFDSDNLFQKNGSCRVKDTISKIHKNTEEEQFDKKVIIGDNLHKEDKMSIKGLHEYCEISVPVKSKELPVKIDSKVSSNNFEDDPRYHEITFPEIRKPPNDQNRLARSNKIVPDSMLEKEGILQIKSDEVPSKTSLSQNVDVNKVSNSINIQNDSIPMDVFNLGAKPCSNPIDIKTTKKLSSSPSSDGSSSSQTSAVYLCNDNRKLSQGSVTSLSSDILESLNTKIQISTTASVQNLENMPGDRRSYQELVSGSIDSTNFNLCSRQLSRSSVGSIESQNTGLNYATLDLSTSLEEPGLTNLQMSPGGKSMHSHDEQSNNTISYAQIDFEKSVTSTSSLKTDDK